MIMPEANLRSPAQQEFEQAAYAANMDPHDKWVGGYVRYEWDHLRPLLDTYGLDVNEQDILELGCNVGGSSIVMTALGARVSAIDIDPAMVRIAKANFARHGLNDKADIQSVNDSRELPYPDNSFDHVIANSVLEYVAPEHLDSVLAELHRTLKPGGSLFICGTASRVAPKEIHSGRWLVNYIPRWFDQWTGRQPQRGLSPLQLGRALNGRFECVSPHSWRDARSTIHGKLSLPVRLVDMLAQFLVISPGWISPHIELQLQKTT